VLHTSFVTTKKDREVSKCHKEYQRKTALEEEKDSLEKAVKDPERGKEKTDSPLFKRLSEKEKER
jgi:hypothetical protein